MRLMDWIRRRRAPEKWPDSGFSATAGSYVNLVAQGVASPSGKGDTEATHVAVLVVPSIGLARPLFFGSPDVCDQVCSVAPDEVEVNAARRKAQCVTVPLSVWEYALSQGTIV